MDSIINAGFWPNSNNEKVKSQADDDDKGKEKCQMCIYFTGYVSNLTCCVQWIQAQIITTYQFSPLKMSLSFPSRWNTNQWLLISTGWTNLLMHYMLMQRCRTFIIKGHFGPYLRLSALVAQDALLSFRYHFCHDSKYTCAENMCLWTGGLE